jgi:hypothetical protein
MTVDEMAERIVETVGGIGGGVTFAEIVNAVGEEAKGDGQLGWPDLNVVLWTDVSENFIKAFNLAKERIFPVPTEFLTYAMDGMLLNLPVARQLKKSYKDPHWLPVVFWLRDSKVGKRLSDLRMGMLGKMK